MCTRTALQKRTIGVGEAGLLVLMRASYQSPGAIGDGLQLVCTAW